MTARIPAEAELATLSTELRNGRSSAMDTMPVAEFLAVMNFEDQSVALAVRAAIPQIAEAAQQIATSLSTGGRLVYLGAGTSGRIGLLDAVECPPTFGTDPEQILVLLAGGTQAFGVAAEGAEDSPDNAIVDIDEAGIGERDTVVGLAASGRTPYVIAGLDRAAERGAATVSVACNRQAACSEHAQIAIEVDTGPEVLTGSTRLKAGTAQKLVCNMLSTAAMVQLGKTYQNLMIDMRPTNEKLVDRARRIVAEAAGVEVDVAAAALRSAGNRPKVATVMLLAGVSAAQAERRLATNNGFVAKAIG
ncbi:MAG: N-acetylmuramic acid 6-phosphate etherase [Actinomycetota bacterium]|nr:N-acetylmuramic acid 6-phosphate etherase [Actinomycetota bacterium]MDQ2956483.1 N-acetylmuramic acid 6-phosphate etherase [Actinomycetota bacterium]